MNVLVIPDVHLKPCMFQRAAELMKEGIADRAVCLMDIADDWGQQANQDLYIQSYDAAIAFAKEYPDSLWCYGNHDMSYLWGQWETGYSSICEPIVCEKMKELANAVPNWRSMAFIHRIDDVLFMHGGLTNDFVKQHFPSRYHSDVNYVIETINSFGIREMWNDGSPLWYRPESWNGRMYKPRTLLQVVGHTPVKEITRTGNTISCDNFSTMPDGTAFGKQEFLLINTVGWNYWGIK